MEKYRVSIYRGQSWYWKSLLFGNKVVATEGLLPIELYGDGSSTVGGILSLGGRYDGNFPVKRIK